jgi:hypothetical protein
MATKRAMKTGRRYTSAGPKEYRGGYESTLVEMSPDDREPSVQEDGSTILRNSDGTITIEGAQAGPRIPVEGDFDENLCGYFTAGERQYVAEQLVEYARVDKESRADWELKEERCLEMLGIKEIPPDRDESPGFHKVVHPMLAEACVQFQARAIAEFYPATGPVKCAPIGRRSQKRIQQAERVETFMNYYLTGVDTGYFPDTDQMLLYLPMAGSAFRKCMPDWRTGLPQLRYFKGTNFIAPYSGLSLDTMPRYAHRYTMSGLDIQRGIDRGMLYDVNLQPPAMGEARHSSIEDMADFRSMVMHEDDRLYNVLEYHIDIPLASPELSEDEDGIVLPYIVLVEETNREILLMRRNWKQMDEQRRKRIWFAHYRFLPGLGFYGFGFPHVIGSLGRAASGAVNALLDAALVANLQGGFKTREGKGMAGEVRFTPGVWKDTDLAYEEISKAFYTPNFKEPSPALFNLLDRLVMAGQRFASTTEVMVGQADNRGPVGTTVALIEESSRVYTAIHKRMHNSAGEEFRMLSEYIGEYMPSEYTYDHDDQTRTLLREDFDGRVDVLPVSDPNIFSSTQRIALAQAVIELQTQFPQLYPPQKMIAAHRRLLEALRVPDLDEVAPEIESPQYIDPVSENGLMLVGKGVKAFEYQDHEAHNIIHANGLQWALAANQDPEQQQQIVAAFQAHMREHQALNYRQMIAAQLGIPMPPLDQAGMPQEVDPEFERKFSRAVLLALPPPPQPEGDQAAAEGEAVLDKSKATIVAKDRESLAKVERDTLAFVAEEQRKQKAFEAEQRRANTNLAFDLSRDSKRANLEDNLKDRAAAADMIRGGAKAKLANRQAEQSGKLKLNLAAQQAKAKSKTAAKKKGNGATKH